MPQKCRFPFRGVVLKKVVDNLQCEGMEVLVAWVQDSPPPAHASAPAPPCVQDYECTDQPAAAQLSQCMYVYYCRTYEKLEAVHERGGSIMERGGL